MFEQKSDAGGEEVEIPVENQAFMDDFFTQVRLCHITMLPGGVPVWHFLIYACVYVCLHMCGHAFLCVCTVVWFKIEDIRTSIDKIDESVNEIKKLYSTILSAPTSDQSECVSAFLLLILDSTGQQYKKKLALYLLSVGLSESPLP